MTLQPTLFARNGESFTMVVADGGIRFELAIKLGRFE